MFLVESQIKVIQFELQCISTNKTTRLKINFIFLDKINNYDKLNFFTIFFSIYK